MWILLNGKPVNILTSKIEVDKVRFVNPENWSDSVKTILKDIKVHYSFAVYIDDEKPIFSKHYETKEEAIEARNNLLLQMNKLVASLPKIEI